MQKFHAICLISIFAVICSCNRGTDIPTVDAHSYKLCSLKENIGAIKEPRSFDFVSDSLLVLTDRENVYLYTTKGEQVRKIGNVGRAKYEYVMPSVVRSFEDQIYVWSSGTLKFIVYLLDGTPVAEYSYPSTVTDFVPSSECIFIYTAGRRYQNIVDVYKKNDQCITSSLTASSPEHKFLLHNVSASPIYLDGDDLIYASKDKLAVMDYNLSDGKTLPVEICPSETFEVKTVADSNLIFKDRTKAMQYFLETSMVLQVFPGSKGYNILTVEGKSRIEGDELKNEDRYFCLYDTGLKSGNKCIARYSYSSVGTQILFCFHDGSLYFIRHSIENDNDVYSLCRMNID